MIRSISRALLATIVLAAITGLAYPLAITGLARLAFPGQAGGSLVRAHGAVVGSSHIGQAWEGPRWFYGRPSAGAYDATQSGGSNLGPNSKVLRDQIRQRAASILSVEGPFKPGLTVRSIPADLLTASASGLDPDTSPASAYFQAPRVASVRHLSIAAVRQLIRRATHTTVLGLFGVPHVNVLELNLALERMSDGQP